MLKAGGAYLPLDINSPAERLRLMIDDANAVAVFSESGVEDKEHLLTLSLGSRKL